MNPARATVLSLLCCIAPTAAQQLDARISCSATGDDGGEPVLYADHGRIRLDDDRIESFYWESALHRATHGFDCSIDEEDGLTLDTWEEEGQPRWRIGLQDPLAARARRGYDFSRGSTCNIRLRLEGELLHVAPNCPVLCGSRGNFSGLSIHTRTGECHYAQ